MLDPQARHIYLSALRPPDGYQFDRAISTTFTLDLMALLMAPMSMIMRQAQTEDTIMTDPIAILESLRQTTDKLAVFCQAGRISIPQVDSQLYSYLEPIVVEVEAPGNGVFHPKVWILRFVANDESVIYRLLCLSRNLTFDRSWDTILTLEGELNQERSYGYSLNRPLRDLVSALPDLALHQPLPTPVQTHIEIIADEIGRVQFNPPPEFEKILAYSPSGISGYKKQPPLRGHSRLLVMSPFLTDQWLVAITDYGANNVLISRQAALDNLEDETWQRLEANQTQVYVMQEMAERPEDEEPLDDEPSSSAIDDLTGLHAKLFITETGWQAHVFTGSANATNAGYNGANVEFMVGLVGKKSLIGIKPFLGSEKEDHSLLNMLQPYHRPETGLDSASTQQRLEHILNQARQSLIEAKLSLTVSSEQPESFNLTLAAEQPTALQRKQLDVDSQIVMQFRPISLDRHYAKEVRTLCTGEIITFANISPVALTSFLAFELTASEQDHQLTIRFVLNVPISGLPLDRDRQILRSIISDKGRFIRYLLLLLADNDESGFLGNSISGNQNTDQGNDSTSGTGFPLLEELVRAASRHPEKITRIVSFVNDLRESGAAEKLLPHGFDQIWVAFEQYQKLNTEKHIKT